LTPETSGNYGLRCPKLGVRRLSPKSKKPAIGGH
jgi:hypothetical protein